MDTSFLTTVFGDTKLGLFFGYFVLAFIGHVMQLLMQATNRNPQSDRTPFKFSWNFLFQDNAWQLMKAFAMNMIVIFIAIRFAPQILATPLSPFVAIGIGAGLSKLVSKVKVETGIDDGATQAPLKYYDPLTVIAKTHPGSIGTYDYSMKKAPDTAVPIQQSEIDATHSKDTESVVVDHPVAPAFTPLVMRMPALSEVLTYAATARPFMDSGCGSCEPTVRIPTLEETQAFATTPSMLIDQKKS